MGMRASALLLSLLLASCAVATGRVPPAQSSAAPPAAVPPTSAPATAGPTAPATLAPSPARTPAPAPVTPPQPGLVRNDGQAVIAMLPHPESLFVGEGTGTPAVVRPDAYTLNGTPLGGADVRCSVEQMQSDGRHCTEVRLLLPGAWLREGVRYRLTFQGVDLGSFAATGLTGTRPRVLSVRATQKTLTVAFDRPMKHAADCGTVSHQLAVPGTIEWIKGGASIFPPAIAGYGTTAGGLATMLVTSATAQIGADCRSVTFSSAWGAPAGTFPLTVRDVADASGNLVEPVTISVTVVDEGVPALVFAQVAVQTAQTKRVRLAFSEAMDEETATDPERYLVNGRPLAAGVTPRCELAGCAWVTIDFPPSTFAYGADNILTIVGVTDTSGLAMAPDIVDSKPFQVR